VLDLDKSVVAAALWQQAFVDPQSGFHTADGQWVFVGLELARKNLEDNEIHVVNTQVLLHKHVLHFSDTRKQLLQAPAQELAVLASRAPSMGLIREDHCKVQDVVVYMGDHM
jgi:hypothetical protein